MTRALRARHRLAFAGLAALLPAGVALALVSRAALPPAPPSSVARLAVDEDRTPLTVAWQASAEDHELAIVARIGWTAPPTTGAAPSAAADTPLLDLDVHSAVGQPELLVYWSPADVRGDALPAGSRLLGPVRFHAPVRFALPDAARTSDGRIALYSVAQGRVAGTIALPAAARIPRQGAAR